MALHIPTIREQFPALQHPLIFFDNPGGTQVARQSLDRMVDYLVNANANHGGSFATSRASDAIVDTAREACADFLNAARPEEIVLGPNMTSLTFRLGRALAPTFQPGESMVLTRLDHDANVTPWARLAEDRGMRVCVVDFDVETGMLNLESLRETIEREHPRLVAVGYASNALGTVSPIREITRMAHESGALVYVDAVQYAPHGPIDVQDLGVDFLVCSAYKFFGPHVGVLYGRYDLLEELRAYKVRPAPDLPPGKFETGTNNFEGIAGVLGALEYLQWVGETFGGEHAELYAPLYSGRRLAFKQGMAAIRSYEFELSRALLNGLESVPGVRVYGPADPMHLEQRVPTFSFTMQGQSPSSAAQALAERNINVWDGHFYAVNVVERLGLQQQGGLVRVGAVHYNTLEEVHALVEALRSI